MLTGADRTVCGGLLDLPEVKRNSEMSAILNGHDEALQGSDAVAGQNSSRFYGFLKQDPLSS